MGWGVCGGGGLPDIKSREDSSLPLPDVYLATRYSGSFPHTFSLPPVALNTWNMERGVKEGDRVDAIELQLTTRPIRVGECLTFRYSEVSLGNESYGI